MAIKSLSEEDRRFCIISIFQGIAETRLPTPYADQRSIPKISTNHAKCRELSEEVRQKIHVRIANIEAVVGSKAFELGKRGDRMEYDFPDMLVKLDRDIGYYRNKFESLKQTYEEFLKWLDTYNDKVLTLEVQLRFEKDCKERGVKYVCSEASFKVAKGQLQWANSESSDKLLTALGPQVSLRPCPELPAAESIIDRLEKCFNDAIFHLQNSKWTDPRSLVSLWQTPKILHHISVIKMQNQKLLDRFKTTDPTPDLEAFIHVAGQRCERVLQQFRSDCEVNLHSAFLARRALIAWLQFMYREFSRFLEAYPDILLEDEDNVARASQPSNNPKTLNYLTPKTRLTRIMKPNSGVSRKFLNGKLIYKKAPTMGQFWRTKFLKSLVEPEQVYDSRMCSTRRIAKRKYEKYTGKYKDIYMSPDDFEGLKLPPQYQKINTGIPLLDFNGNTVQRKYINIKRKGKPEVIEGVTLITKHAIDLKAKFCGLSQAKNMGKAANSAKEVTVMAAKSSRKRKRTYEDKLED